MPVLSISTGRGGRKQGNVHDDSSLFECRAPFFGGLVVDDIGCTHVIVKVYNAMDAVGLGIIQNQYMLGSTAPPPPGGVDDIENHTLVKITMGNNFALQA